ncbi:hypothetical protein PAE0490 [Pyrobaculum aerophilum str. IM2]|uniref:Uncharacterized protein n=1 Tax=Pyrobaculum aerophilum (strain ATCC 51768 / DSM 7523 / JCM 9630 / CIP 104966 / NBRC 100827 / IM2) TaxID=178306 RepID=Q8ZZ15_PYRAE|nr:hypothetical protein [Pyrobaculum aerophilum]AAL62826.1 hypothetical protein PAE0490 [Pyrobaculum aerophilum str. IM2]
MLQEPLSERAIRQAARGAGVSAVGVNRPLDGRTPLNPLPARLEANPGLPSAFISSAHGPAGISMFVKRGFSAIRHGHSFAQCS